MKHECIVCRDVFDCHGDCGMNYFEACSLIKTIKYIDPHVVYHGRFFGNTLQDVRRGILTLKEKHGYIATVIFTNFEGGLLLRTLDDGATYSIDGCRVQKIPQLKDKEFLII